MHSSTPRQWATRKTAEGSKADLEKGQETAASSPGGCCMPGSPELGRQKQDNQEFKVVTGFIVVDRMDLSLSFFFLRFIYLFCI